VVTLGQWVVTVEVPDDLAERDAVGLFAAVMTSLAEWATGAEQWFSATGKPV
jgi:hypothetical protein